MVQLSMFRRFALLGSIAFVLAHAPCASAQVPLHAEPAPQPVTPSAPVPVAPVAPPADTPLPAPPAAPVAEARPGAPAPAKTDHLVQAAPEAVPPHDYEEGDDLQLGPRRQWYGWQTLAADGASLLLLISAGAVANDTGRTADQASATLVAMGVVGYEFAPGIVHFAHGYTGRGFASFGLRLGMPLAGAILGAAAASDCDSFGCEGSGVGLGLLLGMAGAIAIDAAVFAYDDTRPTLPDDDARITPLVVVAPRAAFIGVGGRL